MKAKITLANKPLNPLQTSKADQLNQLFKKPVLTILFATLACLLWGSAFPSIKVSYNLMDIGQSSWIVKMQFAGYRFLLSSVMIFAFMYFMNIDWKLKRQDWMPLLILGLCQTTIQYIFFYVGVSNTSGVVGSILTSVGTFFSLLLPHFYYRDDKLNLSKILGLIVGFSGVFIVATSGGSVEGHFKWYGEGLLMISSFVSAVGSIIAKEVSSDLNPVKVNAWQLLMGSTIMVVFSLIGLGGNAVPFNLASIPIFIHLAFISGAAYTIWFLLLKNNKVSKISIYKFQVPVWGSILSAIFIVGESITVYTLISLILTAVGIILVNLEWQKKRKI